MTKPQDDRRDIETIRERLDIVDIVSQYLTLKKAGQNYVALCPFHDEKTPSFSVSPTLQRYKCFGCGETGDIFDFIQKIEKLDFPEALKKLAKQAGVELKHTKKKSKYFLYEEINKLAGDFYYLQLANTPKAIEYVKKRHLTAQTVKDFKIGYAPKGDLFLKFLQKEGYTGKRRRGKLYFSRDFLLRSGLFVERKGRIRDKFQNRIMFPIHDVHGHLVGFSGRHIDQDQFGPKYLNTPQTPIFRKGRILYGLHKAKYVIRQEDLAIVVEGQIDVIMSYQHGLQNTVAPQGTALTEQQLELLRTYTDNVLFVFDNDDAGQKALEKSFILANKLSFTSYVFNPQPYSDMDEFLNNSDNKADEILSKKEDAFSYLVKRKLSKLDISRLDDRKRLEKYVRNLFATIKDDTQRKFAMEQIPLLTGMDIAIDTRASDNTKTTPTKQRGDVNNNTELYPRESYFIRLLLLQNKLETVNVDETLFADPDLREIVILLNREDTVFIKDVFANLREGSSAWRKLEDILMSPTELAIRPGELADEISDTLSLLEIDKIQRDIKSLRQRLVQSDDPQVQTELLKEMQALSVQLNNLKGQKIS